MTIRLNATKTFTRDHWTDCLITMAILTSFSFQGLALRKLLPRLRNHDTLSQQTNISPLAASYFCPWRGKKSCVLRSALVQKHKGRPCNLSCSSPKLTGWISSRQVPSPTTTSQRWVHLESSCRQELGKRRRLVMRLEGNVSARRSCVLSSLSRVLCVSVCVCVCFISLQDFHAAGWAGAGGQ